MSYHLLLGHEKKLLQLQNADWTEIPRTHARDEFCFVLGASFKFRAQKKGNFIYAYYL